MRKRTKVVALMVFMSMVAGARGAAAQSHTWYPPWTADTGCATSISVGPNNVPWVVGCDGPGPDHSIFYLTKQTSCGNLICQDAWQIARGLKAVSISVSLNGIPYAVTSSGAVWAEADPGPGNWAEMTPWPYSPGSCLSWLAVPAGVDNAPPPEQFVTDSPATFGYQPSLWGIGCGGGDQGVWTLPFMLSNTGPLGSTTWQQVDAQDNAAAVQIAMFTTDAPPNYQTPWVINSQGSIYAYNPATGGFAQQPGAGAWSITDHFVAAWDAAYQWSDAIQNWVQFIGSTPNAPIKQLAYSEPIHGTAVGTIGPSWLWAIDTNGGIYYAGLTPPPAQ
jgi:hypothetical protein